MMIKIYTKIGDKGETSLYSGKQCSKDDPRVETYGTVDELNSAIGVVIAEVQGEKLKVKSEGIENILRQIQRDLFIIGAVLAGDVRKLKVKSKKLKVRIEELENMIDWMAERLPEQQNFILPGGSKGAAQLHLTRAICRRAERRVVALINLQVTAYNLQSILIYLNRLSDFLFMLAKWVNKKLGVEEIVWVKE